MALKAILDTRFFFALYNPSSRKQEEWCRSVVLESKKKWAEMSSPTFAVSVITIAELYENMVRLVGREVVRLRISSARNSGIQFIPIDDDIAEQAGILKLTSGYLPMADAIISATANTFANGRLFTDDPHFEAVKDLKLSWIT